MVHAYAYVHDYDVYAFGCVCDCARMPGVTAKARQALMAPLFSKFCMLWYCTSSNTAEHTAELYTFCSNLYAR